MFLKVGNMAYDVKIREVRSWEIIELLRSEESESNTVINKNLSGQPAPCHDAIICSMMLSLLPAS